MSEHGEPIDVMGSAYMFYLASGHSPGAVNQVKKEMTLGHRHWHDFHELTVVPAMNYVLFPLPWIIFRTRWHRC